jgi:CubicO group peptidase (beta-lactamase class C family)
MKRNLLLLAFAALTTLARAQSIQTTRIDSLLTRLAEHDKAMGSLAILKNGKVVYERAIGWSRPGVAATPQTRYRIGSITKTFTSVLVFQQVEAGRLSLQTRLSKFYPRLPNAGSITIGQLLQHRSGIMNITDDTAYLRWTRSRIPRRSCWSA